MKPIKNKMIRSLLSISAMPLAYIINKRRFNETKDMIDNAFNGCFQYIKPMQKEEELAMMIEAVNSKNPKTIMEIGTARGGTLFMFAKATRAKKIISLDFPGGDFGGGYPLWKIPLFKSFARKGQEIRLIRGDSHMIETQKIIEKVLKDERIDVLFIDGDHTYEGVKKDYILYSKFVRKGGLIVLHDINEHESGRKCEVDKFWNEIKKGTRHKEIIFNKQEKWAGIGIIEK